MLVLPIRIHASDWDMFCVASENNMDIYTDTVTEFIRKCIGDVFPN